MWFLQKMSLELETSLANFFKNEGRETVIKAVQAAAENESHAAKNQAEDNFSSSNSVKVCSVKLDEVFFAADCFWVFNQLMKSPAKHLALCSDILNRSREDIFGQDSKQEDFPILR